MSLISQYYAKHAAAYVRGVALQSIHANKLSILPASLTEKSMDELTGAEIEEILMVGEAAGLKLYRFKPHDGLPRIKKVLGFLKAIDFESILDVGSGRGVFLWACLNTFPKIDMLCVDILTHRVDMINTASQGGLQNLRSAEGDICSLDLPDKSRDVVTMLEVLEHIPDTAAAVREAVRIARKYVVVSVPSKPDDNPEHIHLLTKDILTGYFTAAGCTRLRFDGVPNHLILIAGSAIIS